MTTESVEMRLIRERDEARAVILARDTARLDWLDAEHDRVDPVMRLIVKRHHDRNSSEWANTTDARAAIDAAMDAAPTAPIDGGHQEGEGR